MSPMGTVKFIGAWGCLIGSIALVTVTKEVDGLPLVLAVYSALFSLAPATA